MKENENFNRRETLNYIITGKKNNEIITSNQ